MQRSVPDLKKIGLRADIRRVAESGHPDELTSRLLELEHRAALIARQVIRLRERPMFIADDITERQAAELERRLRHVHAEMAAVRAGRQ
jgi:hypothetical protein